VARHSPLVLIDLEPNHPLYRCFHGVPDTEHGLGVCALDLAQQAEVRHLAQGFYRGQLCGDAVNQAVQRALERVASAFAAPPPLDPRVAQLMVLLDEDPGSPLPELARRVGLSPHRASQLFSQNMGLPLRRYVLSAKIRRAARFMGSGRRLTDVAQAAGFVDSAHFAKVWILNYGAPPSAFFPAQRTAMDELGLPDWVRWHLARRPAGLGPPSTRSPLIN
jgi:transcriptional regulator GlxA family with amidase domain